LTVAVVSSVYGGFDNVGRPDPSEADDWILVAGEPVDAPPPWRVIVEPRPHMVNRLAAKVAKCRPDRYTDADVVVWMDGAARPREGWRDVLCGPVAPIVQWVHPERDSIVAEATVSAQMGKYGGQAVEAQAASYVADGHPDDWGLWAAGVIVYRPRLFNLPAFGDAWLSEQIRWSYQDQISEPYVLRRHGLRPEPLPGGLWAGQFVGWEPHWRAD